MWNAGISLKITNVYVETSPGYSFKTMNNSPLSMGNCYSTRTRNLHSGVHQHSGVPILYIPVHFPVHFEFSSTALKWNTSTFQYITIQNCSIFQYIFTIFFFSKVTFSTIYHYSLHSILNWVKNCPLFKWTEAHKKLISQPQYSQVC